MRQKKKASAGPGGKNHHSPLYAREIRAQCALVSECYVAVDAVTPSSPRPIFFPTVYSTCIKSAKGGGTFS